MEIIRTKHRDITDVPDPKTKTTRHTIQTSQCRDCHEITTPDAPIPKTGSIGFNLLAATLQLQKEKCVCRGIIRIIKTSYSWDISARTVSNTLQRTGKELKEEAVEEIRQKIIASKYANFDETGMSINGKRGWAWIARHRDLFYYFLSYSRGRDVLKKYFAEFKGICICDGWPPYGLFKIIQRCWAHMLRETKYVWIQLETESSKEFYDKIIKIFARITAKEITESNRRLYNSAIK